MREGRSILAWARQVHEEPHPYVDEEIHNALIRGGRVLHSIMNNERWWWLSPGITLPDLIPTRLQYFHSSIKQQGELQ
jgi:hypothetical protein